MLPDALPYVRFSGAWDCGGALRGSPAVLVDEFDAGGFQRAITAKSFCRHRWLVFLDLPRGHLRNRARYAR